MMSADRTLSHLAGWLLDPTTEPPPVQVLRDATLAAYAYAVLPDSHPARPALRQDFLPSLVRHQRLRAELLPLVAAWNRAGIEPLLFKGFQLAEFVYPAPGTRFHGDVDVLVRPDEVETARRVARAAGWAERDVAADHGRPESHNVCSLYGPAAEARVDLHRWAVHARLPWTGVQRRITAALRAAAVPREWEGVRIREPAPLDALLVGLILQRCWGDGWRLKAHDAVDFRLLASLPGVSPAALGARAQELNADRTVAIFLQRCDPWSRRLDLRPPTPAEQRRWDRAVQRERPLLGRAERLLMRLRVAPAAARDAARVLPSVLAAHTALRRGPEMPALLQRLTPSAPAPPPAPGAAGPSRAELHRVVRGVRWATRLLPREPRGDCLLRSLALYHALRRRGWPVRFVSGVRREPGGVQGHAWVELGGEVLHELGEPDNRRRYAVTFAFPPAADGAPDG